MSIIEANYSLRLSGGASNAVGAASIGGVKSSEVASATVDAVFGAVSAAQAAAGVVRYRCFYLHNANATGVMTAARLWVSSNTPLAGTTIDVGVGAAAVNATETAVANENTAPASVSFSAPTNAGTGLALGTIPAGQHKALWLRLTVTAGATNSANDPVTLAFDSETT